MAYNALTLLVVALLLAASAAAASTAQQWAPPQARRRLAGGGKTMVGPVVGEAVLGPATGKAWKKHGSSPPAIIDLGAGEAAVAVRSKHVNSLYYLPDGEAVIGIKGKYSPRYEAALAGTAGEAVLVGKKG